MYVCQMSCLPTALCMPDYTDREDSAAGGEREGVSWAGAGKEVIHRPNEHRGWAGKKEEGVVISAARDAGTARREGESRERCGGGEEGNGEREAKELRASEKVS